MDIGELFRSFLSNLPLSRHAGAHPVLMKSKPALCLFDMVTLPEPKTVSRFCTGSAPKNFNPPILTGSRQKKRLKENSAEMVNA